MICVNCGSENDEGTAFCSRCGQTLAAAGGETVGPPTAPLVPPAAAPEEASSDATAPPVPAGPADTGPDRTTPPEPPSVPPAWGTTPAGGEPPRPSHPVSAGTAALLVFGVVVLVGGIIWFALRSHHTSLVGPGPVTPSVTITHATHPPTIPPTTKPPPPPPKPAQLSIAACQAVDQQFACISQGWNQPANSKQFVVLVWVEYSKRGDVLTLSLADADTGEVLTNKPNTFTLTGTTNCQNDGRPAECRAQVYGPGPFYQENVEVLVTYNGSPLKFTGDPPVVILS